MPPPVNRLASLARVALLGRLFRVVVVRAALALLPIAAVVVLIVAIARGEPDRLGSLIGTALLVVGIAAVGIALLVALVTWLLWRRVSSRLGRIGLGDFGGSGGFGPFGAPPTSGTPSPSFDARGRPVIEVDAARPNDPGIGNRPPARNRPL
jgi:hypothetical protein